MGRTARVRRRPSCHEASLAVRGQGHIDLYIQAESFEEAKKLAEAYVQDASLDTTDYPEIVQDVLEVAEYGIIDVE